jgi:hypothetical protein
MTDTRTITGDREEIRAKAVEIMDMGAHAKYRGLRFHKCEPRQARGRDYGRLNQLSRT